jgi:hypothetical protein
MAKPRAVIPGWFRRGLIALTVYLMVLGLTTAYGFWRTADNQHDLDALIERREAELCVRSWQARGEIREAITIPAEALIESASDPDPAAVDLFRANIARRVETAFPDPDCSLPDAEAVIDGD